MVDFSECDQFIGIDNKYKICTGEAAHLPKYKIDMYRVRWGLEPLYNEVKVRSGDNVVNGVIEATGPKTKDLYGLNLDDGPGTVLIQMYKDAGVPACSQCIDLAKQMNRWGPDHCEKEIEFLVNEIFPRAKSWVKENRPWIDKLLPNIIEDAAIRIKIRTDLYKAIETFKTMKASAEPKKANPVASKMGLRENVAVGAKYTITKGAFKSFEFNPIVKARFITSSQLQEDIKILLTKIPSDITAIAGVARSGLSVATMLAMYLHLPMIIIRQGINDVVDAGNGWRLGGEKHILSKRSKVLIVDDTVMTGRSLKSIHELAKKEFDEYLFAAVYVNPLSSYKPDFYAVDLPWPHILEWNVFNSVLSSSSAMDFDGILCHDCLLEDDDDGDRYLRFLEEAKPLYIPRKNRIPLIITARLDKYKEPTIQWLERYGIKFDRLVMHPAKSLRERQKDDIAAYKAKHFQVWLDTNEQWIKPSIFFESDDIQAKRIGSMVIGDRLIICPKTTGVY